MSQCKELLVRTFLWSDVAGVADLPFAGLIVVFQLVFRSHIEGGEEVGRVTWRLR